MGNIFGSSMEANRRKQQEFMIEMNQVMLERQIQMQNQMRERMAAMQVAKAREMFTWFASFYGLATIGMLRGFRTAKNGAIIAPLLPLSFILAYQYDLAYGTKLARIKSEAENILMFETDLVESPAGLPTVSSLDMARLKMSEEAKYKATSIPQL